MNGTYWWWSCGLVVMALVLVGYAVAQEGPAAPAVSEAPAPVDVVIVWAGGTPGAAGAPAPEVGPVDTVTQATPEVGNTKEIAEKLAEELKAAGFSVMVTPAEECRDPRLILQAKALVLGSPEYFGIPPWQMVRFVDEVLYRFYRTPARLSGKVVTAFASGEHCLNTLEGILRGMRGEAVPGAVVGARGPAAERETAVKELAQRIGAALKKE